jgi:hypothetical protein
MDKHNKPMSFADRLKAKLSGSPQKLEAGAEMIDLVDAHLDMVSAAHGSSHLSNHLSHASGHLSGL